MCTHVNMCAHLLVIVVVGFSLVTKFIFSSADISAELKFSHFHLVVALYLL